ncbi:MAG: MOFRL family protein, partial [Thermoanaerobaculia bacterium]
AGSDGYDGSSRAAGAFADGSTFNRARRRGLDAAAALRRHDTQPFFERLGDLFVTGPTGTNVADWAFAVRLGRES